MARTVFYTATSLDGYLADENDSLDWLFAQDMDHDGPLSYEKFIGGVGAVVMGRTTYEWVVQHQEAEGSRWPFAMPSWVFSHARSLPVMNGSNVRFAHGDVCATHAAMMDSAAGKDLWVVGGGDLAAQLAAAGLLDGLMLSIAPVTLGAGRPLLPRRFDLKLISVARNRAFICATYAVNRTPADPAGMDWSSGRHQP